MHGPTRWFLGHSFESSSSKALGIDAPPASTSPTSTAEKKKKKAEEDKKKKEKKPDVIEIEPAPVPQREA